ncbi:MFS transporter [Streptomyces tsukubensis]|uniref:MFS transporter n=1 Tax=Streptomyces tsukubensis TaxID=83656 RepID=A0A1V4A964_9ACTN|nr:MFS transporter [Streptomyces tsukubensis]OON79713.1 MFS transporter [Streptomyces tsukubensis]QFR95903.1 MFS transporter [Streptomyces tsukubensis]
MTSSTPGAASQVEEPGTEPLRRIRDFRLFWLSRVLSGLGSAVTYVAMPILVYKETGSPLLVSLVAAGEAMPYVFFGLLAGALADRMDRRRLMVTSDIANGLCLASIPLASALHCLTAVHIVAAAFLSSTLYIFFDAAGYGVVPTVVGRDRLPQANSAIWGAETAVRIVGTAMAGLLIAAMRPTGVLALDAVTFLASALLIRALTRAAPEPEVRADSRPRLVESIKEGLHFLWNQPELRLMTISGCLQSFAGGAFIGQLVIFADRGLGIREPDPRVGLLFTAWSVGGVLGAVALPRLLKRIGALQIMRVALPASMILGLLTALTSDWRLALPAIAAWGTAYLMVIVNTVTYAQTVTPASLQSRVNTTRRMLSSGVGAPAGAMTAGLMTASFNVRAGLLLAVAAIAVAAVAAWCLRPSSAAVGAQG